MHEQEMGAVRPSNRHVVSCRRQMLGVKHRPPRQTIQQIGQRHREVVRRLYAGEPPKKVAKELGYPEASLVALKCKAHYLVMGEKFNAA